MKGAIFGQVNNKPPPRPVPAHIQFILTKFLQFSIHRGGFLAFYRRVIFTRSSDEVRTGFGDVFPNVEAGQKREWRCVARWVHTG